MIHTVLKRHQRLLAPANLFEHVQHLGLKHGIDSLDRDAGSALGHGKDVHYLDGVFIHKFAKHEAHHLHRHTSTACAVMMVDHCTNSSSCNAPCLSILISASDDT